MEELIYFLKKSEKQLKIELYNRLLQYGFNPIFDDGFIYASGDIPVLVVAHIDTVFEKKPTHVIQKDDMLFNPNGGLGGDDRCGIYIIMQLLNKYRPYVLFTEDEEIGCIGAMKAVKKIKTPNVKFIVEFDRRGKDDCVFYDCRNKDFMNYIEKFGFKTNYGTCSDISILGSAWDIAAVNLSCGYYNEHTRNEFVVFKQLQETLNRAEDILKESIKLPYFNYQGVQYEPDYTKIYELLEEFAYQVDNDIVSEKNNGQSDVKKLRLEKNKKFNFRG